MRFCTENEIDGFMFDEAVFQGAAVVNDHTDIFLDNVRIKPENSCNRDIIIKRANNLILRIAGRRWKLIEEGYQLFDADMNPVRTVQDRMVADQDIQGDLDLMAGCPVDGLEKRKNDENVLYILTIHVDDHTWRLEVEGSGDMETWDRFLNV